MVHEDQRLADNDRGCHCSEAAVKGAGITGWII